MNKNPWLRLRVSPILLVSGAVLGFFTVVPVGFLLFGMFWSDAPGLPGEFTTAHVAKAFTDPGNTSLLFNTLVFAIGSSTMTMMVAGVLAWLIHRTDTPGRRIFDVMPLVWFMFPSMLGDLAWIFLLSPNIGLINISLIEVLGLSSPPFNVYTLWGMIWSQGLSLAPVAYLLIAGAFTTMDPSLEEAARVSGAGQLKTMLRISFPLLSPALLATGALVFMIGINSFETPVFLGFPGRVFVYMSKIYESLMVSVPVQYNLATSQAFIFLLISAAAVSVYLYTTRRLRRYQVVTGKGYRPRIIKLGKWRYPAFAFLLLYVVIALALPVLTIFMISLVPFYSASAGIGRAFATLNLENYAKVLEWPLVTDSAITSLIIGLVTATLTVIASLFMSYVAVKSRLPGRRAFEAFAVMPLAYPGLVFSLALFWMFITIFRPLYGTIWILVAAYMIINLPYGVRAVTNSMVQIHSELEEAARTTGAKWGTALLRITVPILKPALLNAFVFILIASYRQLGAAILLVTPGTYVLPVVILNFWNSGLLTMLAAAAMIYGGILVGIVMVGRLVFKVNITF